MITIGFLEIAAVGAVVLLALLFWGVWQPAVWRLLSILAVASGVGLLVWAITSAAMGEATSIGSPAAWIGTGAGVTVGGIMLLVISFFGKRPV